MNATDKEFAKSAPDEGSYESTTAPWPSELRLFKEEARLEIEFSDGCTHSLPAEYLRVESPSAEVQGHGPSQKKIVSGRRHVKIAAIEPVGRYAIRIVFDDRHDTGRTTTPESSRPARWASSERLSSSAPRRWHDMSAQTRTSTAGGAVSRKCG